jgi:hypothetical protein
VAARQLFQLVAMIVWLVWWHSAAGGRASDSGLEDMEVGDAEESVMKKM